ncbi:MAG: neutral/alkaline non-lysosomal ceramidase N-terminal domain-containing protein [Armatimonadota bacterium]
MISAGAARADITPPVGTWQAGFGGRDRPSEGIHTHLFTRAFAFSDGTQTACLVTNDLIGLSRPEILKIRHRAVRQCPELAPSDIMISCTHTHSGPAVSTYLRGQPKDYDYIDRVCDTIADTIARACDRLEPAELVCGETQVEGYNHNRRDENGYCEKRLAWLEARTPSGDPVAGIVNFTAHPTMHTGYVISGDYAGVLAENLEDALEAPVGMINGCHGNINAYPRAKEDTSLVDDHGRRLAGEVLKVRDGGLQIVAADSVDTASEMVLLTFGPPRPRETYRQIAAGDEGPEYVREWAQDVLDKYPGDPVDAVEEGEVMAIYLGDMAIVGLPGHAFAEICRDIISEVPDRWLMFANHANDYLGYFATREGHQEGGYEVEFAYRFNSSFRWAMDAETSYRIQEAAMRLAGE